MPDRIQLPDPDGTPIRSNDMNDSILGYLVLDIRIADCKVKFALQLPSP